MKRADALSHVVGFVVDRRVAVFVIVAALSALCALLIPRVDVNTDMTKYLADDSSMRAGLAAIEEQWPDEREPSTIRAMAQGLDEGRERELLERLQAIPYVDSVDHVTGSDEYERNGYSLYRLSTDYPYDSEQERSIERSLSQDFSDYGLVFSNDDDSRVDLPAWILVLAVTMLFVILFVMCGSWVEPLLFLVTILFAVLLNMGTNYFLGSISSTTYSIAAVLQLVLSMDYSIILTNRYRQRRATQSDRVLAMKEALADSFPSIASSSLTTIAGLLALLFMSNKIGADIGTVLAKGVLCSAVCTLTALPALIVGADGAIQATAKRVPRLGMGRVASGEHRWRRQIAVGFVVAFAGLLVWQNQTAICFSLDQIDPVAQVFPRQNTTVVVYDADEDQTVARLAESIDTGQGYEVTGVTSFSYTLGAQKGADDLAEALSQMGTSSQAVTDGTSCGGLSLSRDMVAAVIYDEHSGGALPDVEPGALLSFLCDDVLTDERYASVLPSASAADVDRLSTLSGPEQLTQDRSVDELSGFFGIDRDRVTQVLAAYYASHPDEAQRIGAGQGTLTVREFTSAASALASDPTLSSQASSSQLGVSSLLTLLGSSGDDASYTADEMAERLGMDAAQVRAVYLMGDVEAGRTQGWGASYRSFADFLAQEVAGGQENAEALAASGVTDEQKAQLVGLSALIDAVVARQPVDASTMTGLLGGLGESVEQSQIELLIELYAGHSLYDESWTMSVYDFVERLNDAVSGQTALGELVGQDDREAISRAASQLRDARASLVGDRYARMVVTTTLPTESDQTTEFLRAIYGWCGDNLQGDWHVVGNSAMGYEMSQGFRGELALITGLTTAFIFVIVLVTFRSLLIPLILVAIVQCGVCATVVVVGLQGYSIYYLALLIVECILMGATIDYGILFTTYYRSARSGEGVAESLAAAYRGSTHTILTSGSILVIVTGILGYLFENPTIGQICRTISIGALCTLLLILFALPALLACADRFVVRRGGAAHGRGRGRSQAGGVDRDARDDERQGEQLPARDPLLEDQDAEDRHVDVAGGLKDGTE
jgi:predicted RND superfamily exporter protein